jgi:hypothetical protein
MTRRESASAGAGRVSRDQSIGATVGTGVVDPPLRTVV